jgi:hypothetical protein
VTEGDDVMRPDERAEKRAALQWLANALAWEDRLAALRGDLAHLSARTPHRQAA